MKIIKISLPVLAVVAIFSNVATQSLERSIAASADAGALSESTVIFNKMYTQPRLAKANAEKRAAAKTAARTRLAALSAK